MFNHDMTSIVVRPLLGTQICTTKWRHRLHTCAIAQQSGDNMAQHDDTFVQSVSPFCCAIFGSQ